MSSGRMDVLNPLPRDQKAVVRYLDSIRARLKIEHALSDADTEIRRCLGECVCPEQLIKVAIVARDYGLPIVGPGAAAAADSNFDRNIWIPSDLGHDYAAADALDLFFAMHRESTQKMECDRSTDVESIQLPLFFVEHGDATAACVSGAA